MNSFYTLVDQAVQNTKPLLCIGFYLPGKVDLANVDLENTEFKDEIYFSYATFAKGADFRSATFTKEATFLVQNS